TSFGGSIPIGTASRFMARPLPSGVGGIAERAPPAKRFDHDPASPEELLVSYITVWQFLRRGRLRGHRRAKSQTHPRPLAGRRAASGGGGGTAEPRPAGRLEASEGAT